MPLNGCMFSDVKYHSAGVCPIPEKTGIPVSIDPNLPEDRLPFRLYIDYSGFFFSLLVSALQYQNACRKCIPGDAFRLPCASSLPFLQRSFRSQHSREDPGKGRVIISRFFYHQEISFHGNIPSCMPVNSSISTPASLSTLAGFPVSARHGVEQPFQTFHQQLFLRA